MTKEARAGVVNLLGRIHDCGLDELVADNHAFLTLCTILKTGTSLPMGMKEPKEDTEFTAKVLSNPVTWGIADERWREFCLSWVEKR